MSSGVLLKRAKGAQGAKIHIFGYRNVFFLAGRLNVTKENSKKYNF